jgi:hypothetical protein
VGMPNRFGLVDLKYGVLGMCIENYCMHFSRRVIMISVGHPCSLFFLKKTFYEKKQGVRE